MPDEDQRRAQHRSVGVELELALGRVAAMGGRRAAVSLQRPEHALVDIRAAEDGVEGLQLGRGELRGVQEPAEERGALPHQAHRDEGVQHEGGIAQPAEAVVPVARRPDRLGQGGRGGRHHRSRLAEGQQAQRDQAAHDGVAEGAAVVDAPHVGAPVVERRVALGEHGRPPGRDDAGPAAGVGKRDGPRLPRPQRLAPGERALRDLLERDLRLQQQEVAPVGGRPGPAAAPPQPQDALPVVGSGRDVDVDRRRALDGAHDAQHAPGRAQAQATLQGHRHEVGHLEHAVLRLDPGHEHGRVLQIAPRDAATARGADVEPPAALGVEHRGEDGAVVEVGQAEPVDRAVARHQRGHQRVADQRVVPDGRVAARAVGGARRRLRRVVRGLSRSVGGCVHR